MWFDTRAALAEIAGSPPAEPAPRVAEVAKVAKVAAPLPEITPEELARDLYEERAAIREFDGEQDRAEAERAAWIEARRSAGVTDPDKGK